MSEQAAIGADWKSHISREVVSYGLNAIGAKFCAVLPGHRTTPHPSAAADGAV